MDFADSPADAQFRAHAREWLAVHAPVTRGRGRVSWSDDATLVAAAREWQSKKAAAGYAAVALPGEYGGGGGTTTQQVIFRQEEERYDVPFGVYEIGLGMCVPTLLALGSDQVKERFIARAINGEEIWCQLFSEPAAGSDLAALRTKAVKAGDNWVVDGQKAWTTGAQFSDYGLLLARTDPSATKHAGLTLFIVDMRAPGVEVRPIRQLDGGAEFNEVFLSGVVIPDEFRLTAPGGGWAGAMTTLMFERLNVGANIGLIDSSTLIDFSGRLETSTGRASDDPLVRDMIAQAYLNDRGLKLLTYRTLTNLGRGQLPGPEQSITKLVIASQAQLIANLLLDLRGKEGALAGSALGEGWEAVERSWSFGAAMRIAGGTDEILRNVIAERVLGLPAAKRDDTARPFNEDPA